MSEGTVTSFLAELKPQADAIVARYERKRAAILPVLRLFQERYGCISEEIEQEVAEYLEIPPIDVREVVSFYTLLRRKPAGKTCLNVCRTLACTLGGGEEILRHFEEKLGIRAGETTPDGKFTLEAVECLGACEIAPMMQVDDDYVGPVTKEGVERVIARSPAPLRRGFGGAETTKPACRQAGQSPSSQFASAALRLPAGRQGGLAKTEDWSGGGLISRYLQRGTPYFLDDYLKEGGYEAARQAFEKFAPAELIEAVKKSNLRGLGGAGFPAGMKWSFVPKNTGKPVYLVVNADEGEPGTFKDRYILVSVPHLLLEGILIASYANQSHKAFLYLRGEYEGPYQILTKAVEEAKARGFLGKNIFGKHFDLEIVVHRGAGAYIAGEETGMLESLEGKKAFPRLKPPFPAVVGLFGCPTVINNVETLSYLPFVVKLGAEKFAALGSPKNGGLRLFSVSGHVKRPGVYERPLGYSLRRLIEDAGGMVGAGLPRPVEEGKSGEGTSPLQGLKAVVPGGLSAAVLKADEIDVGLDFDQLRAAGTMAGSAGIMVMDETTCMVEALYVTMRFFGHESCGQCSPCREGTGWVAKILGRILGGRGRPQDIDTLLDLCNYLGGTTICALADGAAMPLGSYLRKFRNEFEFHIREKRCDVRQ